MNWWDDGETYTEGPDLSQYDIVEVMVAAGAILSPGHKGGWWDDEVKMKCPFCADLQSRRPAGSANAAKNVYFCYSCGFGGNVLQVARKVDPDDPYGWLEAVKADAR